MFCSNCGEKVEEGDLFCPMCGARVEEQDDAGAAETGKDTEPKMETAAEKKRSIIPIVVIAAVVLPAVIIGIIVYVSTHTYRSVKIESFEGKVELERNGDDKDIFEGLKLIPDDEVETGDDGIVELLIDSDKHLVASENTEFTIDAVGNENSGKVTIHLKNGSTLVTIDEKLAEDSAFKVETPNCTCSVRGTVFRVTYDPATNTTWVDVIEGIVHVTTETQKLDLNAGESAVITDDAITPVTSVSANTAEEESGGITNETEEVETTEAPEETEEEEGPETEEDLSAMYPEFMVGEWVIEDNNDGRFDSDPQYLEMSNRIYCFYDNGTGFYADGTFNNEYPLDGFTWYYDDALDEVNIRYDTHGRELRFSYADGVMFGEYEYYRLRDSVEYDYYAENDPTATAEQVIGSWYAGGCTMTYTFYADGTGIKTHPSFDTDWDFTWSIENGRFVCSDGSCRFMNGCMQEDYYGWVDMYRQ